MLGRRQANILIVKTGALASYVASEPAFAAIRSTYSDARISLLTTPELQRISRASPYFDQVAAMPNLRDPEARKEFVRQIKAAHFERIFDLSGNDQARKLKGALGMFGPKWTTVNAQSGHAFWNHTGGAPDDLVAALSAVGVETPGRRPDLSWAIEARKDSANMQPSWYGISGRFGLLLPNPVENARWSADGYAELAQLMAADNVMPVLAGPRDLHNFADDIAHQAPQLVDLAGKTDHLQLLALATEADFFVTDEAEAALLAMGVGCHGVVISNAKIDHDRHDCSHFVQLRSPGGLSDVSASFVWRTLGNMGLLEASRGARKSAQAR